MHYYIRTLIYRPAIGSSLGSKDAPALLAVSESSKHIVQIVQLLEERSMCFSFCLNKADTLILCGMALLYQTLVLKQDSKLMKDNERLANAVVKIVERAKAPGSYDFKRVSAMLITLDESQQFLPTPPTQSPRTSMPAPPQRMSPPAPGSHKPSPSLGRHASASMSETDLLLQQEKLRRMTIPHLPPQNRPEMYRARSRPSFDSLRQEVPLARRDHRLSMSQAQAAQAAMIARVSPTPSTSGNPNVDYLPLGNNPSQSQPQSPIQTRGQHPQLPGSAAQHDLFSQLRKAPNVTTPEWEALLGSLDGGQLNVYDAIYGGPALGLADHISTPTTATASTTPWSPDSWDLSGFTLGDFGNSATAQSVLSLSEDSLSSGEDMPDLGDMTQSELGLGGTGLDYGAGLIPSAAAIAADGGYLLDGIDAYGL